VTIEAVTELQATRTVIPPWHPNPRVTIRAPIPGRWYEAYDMARAAIPSTVQQFRPLRAALFQVRMRGPLERASDWLSGHWRERWWADVDGRLRALLTIERRRGPTPHRLEFIIHPEGRGLVEHDLTRHALTQLHRSHTIRANVPTYFPEAIESLRQCGFKEIRTLEQMVLYL